MFHESPCGDRVIRSFGEIHLEEIPYSYRQAVGIVPGEKVNALCVPTLALRVVNEISLATTDIEELSAFAGKKSHHSIIGLGQVRLVFQVVRGVKGWDAFGLRHRIDESHATAALYDMEFSLGHVINLRVQKDLIVRTTEIALHEFDAD